jgi:hypothetical protein
MHRAIAAVASGQLSLRAASKAFNVPFTSLHNHLQHQAPRLDESMHVAAADEPMPDAAPDPLVCVLLAVDERGSVQVRVEPAERSRVHGAGLISCSVPMLLPPVSGPETLMTVEEEQAFAEWLLRCSDMHLPIPKSLANQKAKAILERRDASFGTESGVPGRHWWEGFYRRWPAVGPRKPQPIAHGRAMLTKEHVDAFFADLQVLSVTIPPQVRMHAAACLALPTASRSHQSARCAVEPVERG